MTYAQLDKIADAFNPLLGAFVVASALWLERARAWEFLLRAAFATLIVQQSAKIFQHLGWLGPKFPSTHFAVALCLASCLALLRWRLIPIAAGAVAAYGALMLWQRYHTPLEMLGALYAVPFAIAAQRLGRTDKTEDETKARETDKIIS